MLKKQKKNWKTFSKTKNRDKKIREKARIKIQLLLKNTEIGPLSTKYLLA